MILNFRLRVLHRFHGGDRRGVQPQVASRIQSILDAMDVAESLDDLAGITGFHALRGDRRGSFAVTVTRNWRITFEPLLQVTADLVTGESKEEFYVRNIDYEDYH